MANNKLFNFNVRKVILAIADMFIIGVSSLLSNYVLSALHLPVLAPSEITMETLMLIVVCFLTLWVSGAYRKLWRYFKAKDYLSCVAGTVTGTLLVALFTLLGINKNLMDFNLYGYYILQLLFATCGIVVFRLVFKKTFLIISQTESNTKYIYKKRTLIIGGGQAGKIILKEIDSVSKNDSVSGSKYQPVGIIDDDPNLKGKKINNVPVLGGTQKIIDVCQKHKIDTIIFAIPSADELTRKEILDTCSKTTCEIKVIPYISQLLLGENEPRIINQIKDIKIEDLLGRAAISFDQTKTKQFVSGQVCLVTGGGGSIGSELVRQIVLYKPKQIILLDIYENNAYDIQQELFMKYGKDLPLVTIISSVRDYDRMEQVMKTYKPDVVFHAAAHKHVPLMEDVPEEAVKNNVIGTYNMAYLSKKYFVKKFIMISTDKAVNPTNVMGATKRCCEMIVQYMSQEDSQTEFVTTRFGNVLGSNGSVIPVFKKQIENGKPLTVTHPDIIRYFMTIPEAVSLVLEAAAMAQGGEIFILDMGQPVKIVSLAENLIRMYGKVPYKDIEIKFTGLRPGEKLYEELLMDEEGITSTTNEKIFIGNQIAIDKEKFLDMFKELEKSAKANDSEKTLENLSKMVPTFNHKRNKNNED